MNRTTESYIYDDGDKLLNVSVGGNVLKSYGYDVAGSATSIVSSAGTTALAYDFESRATSIARPGVSQTTCYNELDTRVGSATNAAFRREVPKGRAGDKSESRPTERVRRGRRQGADELRLLFGTSWHAGSDGRLAPRRSNPDGRVLMLEEAKVSHWTGSKAHQNKEDEHRFRSFW